MKIMHVARLNVSSYLKKLGPLSQAKRRLLIMLENAGNETHYVPWHGNY